MSKIHKFYSDEWSLRASIVNSTEVVKEMQSIQHTYPIASMGVGRAMTAASLMASHLKNEQAISLYFKGFGPLKAIYAEANYEGHVRGYTPVPKLEMDLEGGKVSVGKAIGDGTLQVVRTNSKMDEPYKGNVKIQTGEIADDVAFYMQQSFQIPTIISLGVKVNEYGHVLGAGGIFIELLPGAEEKSIIKLEEQLKKAGSISEIITSGGKESEIKDQFLGPFDVQALDHSFDLSYKCHCSKERLLRGMKLFSIDDLDEMLADDKVEEATCDFCGRKYEIQTREIKAIRDEKAKTKMH